MHKKFLFGCLKGDDYLKDMGLYGRIILKCTLCKWVLKDVDWINVPPDKNWWPALVRMA